MELNTIGDWIRTADEELTPVEKLILARSLVRDIQLRTTRHSDLHKACEAGVKGIEVAWGFVENDCKNVGDPGESGWQVPSDD